MFGRFIRDSIAFVLKYQMLILLVATSVLSVVTTYYFFRQGLILAYGDAESHLNISKRVISGITPGFGQLGGNWLPLHHLMMVPFVWNDTLWRTGLGGSIVSMISFIISAIFIYKIVYRVSSSVFASFVAYIIFVTNPNILYMQATPMGKLPLLLSLTGSTYFLMKWADDDHVADLIKSGLFVLIGSLIRYDAWAISMFSLLAILVVGITKKMRLGKIESRMILYSLVAFVGIIAWMVWNKLIFNDYLYFLLSPYSAKAQQLAWLARGQLPSYHNVPSSFAFYSLASGQNTGYLFGILAILGFLVTVIFTLIKKIKFSKFLTLFTLFVPYLFYVLTLYLGISIILISELLPPSFQFRSFNIRYGLMMVPFVAVFVALLINKMKTLGYLFFILIMAMQFYLYSSEKMPIALSDAVDGLSARRPSPVNKYVADNYDSGMIMFDDFSRSANPIDLNIPMDHIIYVGNHPYWDISLVDPDRYITWYIIRHDENDAIWQKFRNNKEFKAKFKPVYKNNKTVVYKKI